MNPLFDMLNQMQSANQAGNIQAQMAKQFGIQQEQAARAMEAVMPAFTEGLKRNAAASPAGMASFMQALASGHHADYLSNPMKAFTPEGMAEGNAILGHLFGNKEVSRAVAAQAEAASGVSKAIIKQMLPALAPMVMGGMFKNMAGEPAQSPQAQHAFGGPGGGILGQILEEMMKGGLGSGMNSPRQSPRGGSAPKNPLESILEQMTGGGTGRGRPTGDPSGQLGDIFRDMLKNGPMGGMGEDYRTRERTSHPYPENDDGADDIFGRPGHRPDTATHESGHEPEMQHEEPKGYPEGTGLEDLFGDLFKPPRSGAPTYDKAIESIFDQFMKPRNL